MTGLPEIYQKWRYGENNRLPSLRSYTPGTEASTSPDVSYPPIPEASEDVVWGVDMSGYWNGIANWQVAKDRGCSFACIKAVDGTTRTRNFVENVLGAQKAGLIVGAYFWLYRNIRISGTAQANAWWNAVKNLNLDFYAVDFEWTFWGGKQDNPDSSDLWGAVKPFEQLSGRKPFIYSAPGYLNQYFNHAPLWGDYPFWIAQYGVLQPNFVMPWGGAYTLWQVTDRWPGLPLGLDPNVSNASDGDIFNGTELDFRRIFGGHTIVHFLEYARALVDLFITPSASTILPLKTPLQQAQENGWIAAMNCGAGFTYIDATHAQMKTTGYASITLDNGQKVYYARKMITAGAANPDLDNIYKAPWSMLGYDAQSVYLMVSEGQEGSSGMTQAEAAQWAQTMGITELYLFDSGHSSGIADGNATIYSAYGEAVPQCIGIKQKIGESMTKGLAKANTSSNVKRMSDGAILASLKGGDSVYGALSPQATDLIDFDHFYKADGSRFGLGVMCKVTVGNLVLSNDLEPGTLPPPPPPPAPPAYTLNAQLVDANGVIVAKWTNVSPN